MLKGTTKKEVATALEKSIEKWRRIVVGTGKDDGTRNCALCELFVNRTGTCSGCPVQLVTRQGGCRGTPYATWVEAFELESENDHPFVREEQKNGGLYPVGPMSLEAAIHEYEFLIGLRAWLAVFRWHLTKGVVTK